MVKHMLNNNQQQVIDQLYREIDQVLTKHVSKEITKQVELQFADFKNNSRQFMALTNKSQMTNSTSGYGGYSTSTRMDLDSFQKQMKAEMGRLELRLKHKVT